MGAAAEVRLAEFAHLARFSNPYLSQIEHRPSSLCDQVLLAIAQTLKVSTNTLYERRVSLSTSLTCPRWCRPSGRFRD